MFWSENRRAARYFSLLVLIAAGALGLWLFGVGGFDQWRRYRALLGHGLDFHDPFCAAPFCDYPLFWRAGRLARHGAVAAIYDHARFFAATGQVAAPGKTLLPFIYPPVTLLPVALLSLPDMVASYYAFVCASLVGGVLLLRRAGIGWGCIAIGLAGLSAMWSLYLGQFGLICAAVLIYGLSQLKRQPVRSGALLACLAIKPQYALLLPAILLSRRDRRALVASILVLAVLIVASILLFGWQAWEGFLGPGQVTARTFIEAPFRLGYESGGTSIFWLMRSLGAGTGVAYTGQFTAFLLASAAAWRVWGDDGADPTARLAVTICLALLASPYGYTDDLVGYSVVLPMLARRDAPFTNAALALLWLAPAFGVAFAHRFGFLPMPFCIALTLLIAWRRLAAPEPKTLQTAETLLQPAR
jgi:hypothetical protein